MTGNERTTARLVWISAVANGALNLALVPIYGATGAAIATVSAQVLHQFSMTWWVAARLRFDTTVLGRRLEV
jgi:O-antigen/teichoic acid export membrane protein